jgi:CheY-like chemotaxis protein
MSGTTASRTPRAFLSYTRLDDESFRGAITSLRRLLELRVRVVTGDRDFEIFQDIEGIELGQKWQKRLDEAIDASMFLIPIVTPLFFSSDPCRDELAKFLQHERNLGRDDLILPVYFVSTPNLEKPEQRARDELAQEIASRQLHDWRDEADLDQDDPQIRKAIRELANGVAAAMDRVSEPGPAEPDRPGEVAELVRTLNAERHSSNTRKAVLWVDDRPDNNIVERRSMAAYNIDVTVATSTRQALAELSGRRFDAIVSDMGRPPDRRAGYTLLDALRAGGDRTPYFIYAGARAARHVEETLRHGGQGTTNRGDELLRMVLQA